MYFCHFFAFPYTLGIPAFSIFWPGFLTCHFPAFLALLRLAQVQKSKLWKCRCTVHWFLGWGADFTDTNHVNAHTGADCWFVSNSYCHLYPLPFNKWNQLFKLPYASPVQAWKQEKLVHIPSLIWFKQHSVFWEQQTKVHHNGSKWRHILHLWNFGMML